MLFARKCFYVSVQIKDVPFSPCACECPLPMSVNILLLLIHMSKRYRDTVTNICASPYICSVWHWD